MLVKFFKCQILKGRLYKGATGAIDYLESTKHERDTPPVVLKGNPNISRELLKQSKFKRPYTAGVLSFEESDIPLSQKMQLIQSFERTLLAGLKPEQYHIDWIEHRDKGRLELNFHIVNTELTTGKRLQPFYDKRDLSRVDIWKKLVNDTFGFSSPDDPAKARTVGFGENNPTRKDIITQIDNYIFEQVADNTIKSNKELVDTLNNIDGVEVTRNTKTGISIKVDGENKNIRLKGGIYGKDFGGFGDPERHQRERAERYNSQREERIKVNKSKLREYNNKISTDRRKQYYVGDKDLQAENDLVSSNTNSVINNHALDNSGRQLDPNNEILRKYLSALRKIPSKPQDSELQNKTNLVINNNNNNNETNDDYNLESIKTDSDELRNAYTATDERDAGNKGRYAARVAELLNTAKQNLQRLLTSIEVYRGNTDERYELSERFTATVGRRETETSGTGVKYDDLAAKCEHVDQLIRGSEWWTRDLKVSKTIDNDASYDI